MKKKGLIITLSIVMVVIIAVFGALFIINRMDTDKGSKDITVTVAYKDKTEKEFEISTDAEYLGDALHEKGLVSDEEYKTGFYTVIDGVRADYTADGAWWCITKGGEMVTKGANELPIADGESFEITYTPA